MRKFKLNGEWHVMPAEDGLPDGECLFCAVGVCQPRRVVDLGSPVDVVWHGGTGPNGPS